jgi:hypothetical protein
MRQCLARCGRLLGLLSGAAAIVAREPRFLLEPRFWAEQASSTSPPRPASPTRRPGSLLVLSALGAMDRLGSVRAPGFGQRDFVAPNTIVLLLLAANLSTRGAGRRARRAVCAVLLVVSLGLAVHAWRRTLLATEAWPDWRGEVQAWRNDPSCRVWPPNTWRVTLRRCAR